MPDLATENYFFQMAQGLTLREDGTRIRTVGKARPWVLCQIPTLVDRRPNNSARRI